MNVASQAKIAGQIFKQLLHTYKSETLVKLPKSLDKN
jgi:hypothetical protein